MAFMKVGCQRETHTYTHTASVMAFMKVGFHSRTRSMTKPKKIQLKPPDSISAECRVQRPTLRAPSVLRLALCTFFRKKLSSLTVRVVVPKRHLPESERRERERARERARARARARERESERERER